MVPATRRSLRTHAARAMPRRRPRVAGGPGPEVDAPGRATLPLADAWRAGAMTEVASAVVRANGIRYHYRAAGDGPAMVLLHGWPQTSYAWRKVIGPLAERFRVIAPDLRGMGDTDRPAAGYDMRTVATDIVELAGALGLAQPYIVGTDWGGLVARRLGLDHPGFADRFAIVDIVPHEQILANLTAAYAAGAWHYFFNAVPDLPERLVGARRRGLPARLLRAEVPQTRATWRTRCPNMYAPIRRRARCAAAFPTTARCWPTTARSTGRAPAPASPSRSIACGATAAAWVARST